MHSCSRGGRNFHSGGCWPVFRTCEIISVTCLIFGFLGSSCSCSIRLRLLSSVVLLLFLFLAFLFLLPSLLVLWLSVSLFWAVVVVVTAMSVSTSLFMVARAPAGSSRLLLSTCHDFCHGFQQVSFHMLCFTTARPHSMPCLEIPNKMNTFGKDFEKDIALVETGGQPSGRAPPHESSKWSSF